jgi:hypothetical protein
VKKLRLATVRSKSADLEQRIADQERRIRKPPAPEPELIVFSQPAALTDGDMSGPFTPIRRSRLQSALVVVGTAPSGDDMVLSFQKNGVEFTTVTLEDGETSILANVAQLFQIKQDVLRIEVTTAAGAEALTVETRFT